LRWGHTDRRPVPPWPLIPGRAGVPFTRVLYTAVASDRGLPLVCPACTLALHMRVRPSSTRPPARTPSLPRRAAGALAVQVRRLHPTRRLPWSGATARDAKYHPVIPGTTLLDHCLLSGPEGPEPALGFFEKKPGLSHFGREQASKRTKVFRPTSPGVARTFFFLFFVFVFVIVYVTLT
jgi:hypothetical protein